MSPEDHEAMIRRYIEEVFNRHDLDGLDQYWATDLVSHWMGQETLRGLPACRPGGKGWPASLPRSRTRLTPWMTSSLWATRACGAAAGAPRSVVRGKGSPP